MLPGSTHAPKILAPTSSSHVTLHCICDRMIICSQVEAQASTESNPLEGFVPRQGEGLLPMLFGKSITNAPPARSNMRIDFQFDFAAFTFSFLPFKIPYPVPFRLLVGPGGNGSFQPDPDASSVVAGCTGGYGEGPRMGGKHSRVTASEGLASRRCAF